MKKKLLTVLIIVCFTFMMFFVLTACAEGTATTVDENATSVSSVGGNGGGNNDGQSTVSIVDNTDIRTTVLTLDGDTISGSFANAVSVFSFLNEITVDKHSTWVVSRDEYGGQTYATKKVPLYQGDNVFFIHVTPYSGTNVKTYTATLHRNYIYTVRFDTDGGTAVDGQQFEEGETYYATEPTTTKLGYVLSGWDHDFSTPITSSMTIKAKWTVAPEMSLFEFSTLNDTCTITGLKDKTLTSVVIPDYVTAIGSSCFKGCNKLTSITIPDGVTSIGSFAFDDCSSLTSITIPDGVTSIDSYAFSSCSSLTSITIPDGVTSIGDYAFYNCSSLTSVTFGDNSKLTNIGGEAFSSCSSLTSITIPDGVTSIGSAAFYNCSSLTSVTIGNGVTSIGGWTFYGCSNLTNVTIPDGVTSIVERAFYNCSSLTSVYYTGTIDDWVSKIDGLGSLMNYGSSDKKLYINGQELTEANITTATKINGYAFYNCSSLTSVTIPDSVTSIGDWTFYGCRNLTSVTIGNGVTSIGYGAFENCSGLTSITIPDGVTSIVERAFENCSGLTSVTIGSGVTSIGGWTFYGCSGLTNVTFKNTSGWYVSESSTATSGTNVTVTDASQNATYLRSTYLYYYWKRK